MVTVELHQNKCITTVNITVYTGRPHVNITVYTGRPHVNITVYTGRLHA